MTGTILLLPARGRSRFRCSAGGHVQVSLVLVLVEGEAGPGQVREQRRLPLSGQGQYWGAVASDRLCEACVRETRQCRRASRSCPKSGPYGPYYTVVFKFDILFVSNVTTSMRQSLPLWRLGSLVLVASSFELPSSDRDSESDADSPRPDGQTPEGAYDTNSPPTSSTLPLGQLSSAQLRSDLTDT